jgi:hypothetical protein
MPIAKDQRDYPTGSPILELSGAFAGPLLSTEGGEATSDVIQEKLGPDPVVRKHLAGVRYTDIELECDARMERNFFDWIRDTLNHKFPRKSGAVSFPDFNYQVESRVEFNALLTGISFPALDAESKDAATMTVKLTPDFTRRQKGSGQLQSAPVGPRGRGEWTAKDFELQIDGLPDCSAVTKIEPLSFTTVVAQQAVGEIRDYAREPTRLNVPDLVLTVPESKAASFYAWHEDFVVKGMNGPQYEKNGTLEFRSPNQRDVILTLELKNLGIYRLASVKPSATGGIARVSAAMYCEEITLAAEGIAPQGSSPSAPSQVVAAPAAVAAAPARVAAPAAATAAPGANGGEPTPMIIAREPGELMRIRPADVQTEPVDVPTDDGVGTSAATATSLGTIPPGTSKTFSGARGPSKPAWFHVTMPCSDSCTARLQMTGGPAFDLYSSPQTPLARGLTLGDVFLSPTLTQLLVNVPEGPWARYTLAIFR